MVAKVVAKESKTIALAFFFSISSSLCFGDIPLLV